MNTSCRISIVIPTYRRRAALQRLLASLARQTFPVDRFEVVVCIDGSEDGTREMVGRLQVPYQLRAFWRPNRGRAAACNAGIRAARGELIVLLDDDMEPVTGWLEAHWRAHQAEKDRGVVGAVEIPISASAPPLVEYVSLKFSCFVARLAQPGFDFLPKDFYSGNFSVRRSVMLEVGAYDEDFTIYGYEDVELCLRLQRAGVHIVFSREALAYQHHDKDFAALARDNKAKGITAILLSTKHPSMFYSLKCSTYHQGSRKWRLLRGALLRLSRVWDGTPGLVIAFIVWLERLRPTKLHFYYSLAFDYFYWLGTTTALRDNQAAHREHADLAALARMVGQ